jgi:hypothetical protein
LTLGWIRAEESSQPRIRDGVVGRAKRASRHQRGAVAGEAGDTMDACSLKGFGQGHRRQDDGEPPCQHRLARLWGTKEEDVVGRTPASSSAPRASLGVVAALTAVAQHPKDAKPKHPPPKRDAPARPLASSSQDFSRLDEPGRRQASGQDLWGVLQLMGRANAEDRSTHSAEPKAWWRIMHPSWE